MEELLHGSSLRNFRATARHYDAADLREFSDGVQLREESAYERFTRTLIESGICWRDPHARRVS
jgi:hypothetical protein